MAHPPHVAAHFDSSGEARVVTRAPARERWSWALYDFANTIFSMNIATLYFTAWLIEDLHASNTMYATVNGVASALVVLCVPILGAISDSRRRRKRWVVGFTVAACLACMAIGVMGQTTMPLFGEQVLRAGTLPAAWHPGFSEMKWVLLAFILASFAYQAAQPFYNAMLPELVPAEEQGRLSGFGVALGYVGSIVGVLLVAPFFSGSIPFLGALGEGTLTVLRMLPFTDHAGRVSTFVPTGFLFLLFSLPLIVFCRDHDPVKGHAPIRWRESFAQVAQTIKDARRHPGALRFIVTTFIYQDAVGTIVAFMTLYAIKAVGFEGSQTGAVLMALTVPAIFGSYFFGWLSDRLGPKRALSTTLLLWVLLLVALMLVPGKNSFWVVGLALGLNFGGVLAAERPMLLSLVPDVEAGRYFSLLLLSARAAAIAGPFVWGITVDMTEPRMGTAFAYRAAVGTVAVMFAISWWLLRGVPDRRPGTPA